MRLMVTWDHYEERLFIRSAMEWFCNVWLKIKCRDNGTESFILIYLRASSDMSFLNGKYERIHLIIVCFPHCVYMWLTVASPDLLAFSFWMQTSVHLGQYLSSDTGSGSPGCLGGGLFSHHLPGQTLGLEMVAKHPGGGGGAFFLPRTCSLPRSDSPSPVHKHHRCTTVQVIYVEFSWEAAVT